MKRSLLLLTLLELAYWVPSRLFVHYYHGGEIEKELLWTAIRLASAIAVYLCFKKILWPADEKPRAKFIWPSLVAAALVVAMAQLMNNWNFSYPFNVVYSATSLVIGVREEMVYRGVLQKLLAARYGLWAALAVSNIAFIFYHYGALPFTPFNVFQFFAMGTILGLMYHQTGSLVFVISVHTLYDGIQCFTPLITPPLSHNWGAIILAMSLALLAATSWRTINQTPSRD